MKNSYPDKQVLGYVHTSVAMVDVIAYLRSLTAPAAVKRMAYVMFRNESANGQSGLNNNYVGAQADGGRWPAKFDRVIVGTVAKEENGTGRARLFVAFRSWTDSVDFLVDRVTARGLFIGGTTRVVVMMTIATELDLVRAYYKEWVQGSPVAEPPDPVITAFHSMYGQALAHFRDDPAPVEGFADHPDAVRGDDEAAATEALNQRQLEHGTFPVTETKP